MPMTGDELRSKDCAFGDHAFCVAELCQCSCHGDNRLPLVATPMSSKGDKHYNIRRKENGDLICDCPWGSSPRSYSKPCRHLKELHADKPELFQEADDVASD